MLPSLSRHDEIFQVPQFHCPKAITYTHTCPKHKALVPCPFRLDDVAMETKTHPTITKRPAAERGQSDHGWLQARFTFSFADYFDPDHMGFKSLRVINNDTIQPGGGFATHPHDNMEIFTYIIEGQLEHKDSMGNGAVIEAGNLQYMSAGSGVTHSEFNPSSENRTLLYQIWLRPKERGGEPRYAEKPLADAAHPDTLTLLFSGDGHDDSTLIRQDAEISFGRVSKDHEITIPGSGHPTPPMDTGHFR